MYSQALLQQPPFPLFLAASGSSMLTEKGTYEKWSRGEYEKNSLLITFEPEIHTSTFQTRLLTKSGQKAIVKSRSPGAPRRELGGANAELGAVQTCAKLVDFETP